MGSGSGIAGILIEATTGKDPAAQLGRDPELRPVQESSRPVVVLGNDGRLQQGREYDSLVVGVALTQGFSEIYFRTVSGNLYAVVRARTDEGEKWVLASSKAGCAYALSEDDIKSGMLDVGQIFRYGSGGKTSEVRQIVAVSGDCYTSYECPPDLQAIRRCAIENANGNLSFIKNEFAEAWKAASSS